jgi:hypothetical protein
MTARNVTSRSCYLITPSTGETIPTQVSQLKSSGRYVILAVMPSVGIVSPDEGTSPRLCFVIAPKLSVLHRDLSHATNFLKICQKYVRTIEKLNLNIFSFKNYIALCCTGEEAAASSNTPA